MPDTPTSADLASLTVRRLRKDLGPATAGPDRLAGTTPSPEGSFSSVIGLLGPRLRGP